MCFPSTDTSCTIMLMPRTCIYWYLLRAWISQLSAEAEACWGQLTSCRSLILINSFQHQQCHGSEFLPKDSFTLVAHPFCRGTACQVWDLGCDALAVCHTSQSDILKMIGEPKAEWGRVLRSLAPLQN